MLLSRYSDSLRQFEALKVRVGVEGFFCVVRSNPEFHFKPRVYWSNPELESYVALLASQRGGWNSTTLGAKVEAFAIAGCDVGGSLLPFTLLCAF
jgi:hypothetical protein